MKQPDEDSRAASDPTTDEKAGQDGEGGARPCSVCRGTGMVPAGRLFPCVVCGEYVAEGEGYRTVAMTWQDFRCIPTGTCLANGGTQDGTT